MSYRNKGSMTATVTVSREPDRSGNFVCDGTADDVEINSALTYVGTIGVGKVVLLEGVYNVSLQITVSNYTTLDMMAGATLSAAVGFGSNPVIGFPIGGGIGVRILGGIIDGNGQEPPVYGIAFPAGSHDSLVEGVEITDIYGMGIIGSGPGYRLKFIRNHIHDLPPYSGTGLSYGIVITAGDEVGEDMYDNEISFNIIQNIVGNCIGLNSGTDGLANHYRERVIGNRLGPTTALDGIQLYYYVYNSIISHNIITNPDRTGIKVDGSSENLICNNVIKEVGTASSFIGIVLLTRENISCHQNEVSNNLIEKSSDNQVSQGITIGGASGHTCDYNKVCDNHIYWDNTTSDIGMINMVYAPYTEVTDNLLYGMRKHGIRVEDSTHVFVKDNYIIESGRTVSNQGHGIYFAGGTDHWSWVEGNYLKNPGIGNKGDQDGIVVDGGRLVIKDNHIFDWNSPRRMRYAINEMAGSNNNRILDNDFIYRAAGPAGEQIVNLVGAATVIHTEQFQFQQGGDATQIQIAQFIHAAGSAKGWEINAANEWAIALGNLPLKLHEVMRIKVFAVGLTGPGAGNEMRIDLLINAAAGDQPYTTEAIDVDSKESDQTNFAVGDIVTWTYTVSDDADIADLRGADNVECRMDYRAAVAPDIATDAVFRCVEFQYV